MLIDVRRVPGAGGSSDEWAIIELQGLVEARSGSAAAAPDGQELGPIRFSEKVCCFCRRCPLLQVPRGGAGGWDMPFTAVAK